MSHDTVRMFFEASTLGDIEEALALVAPDARLHNNLEPLGSVDELAGQLYSRRSMLERVELVQELSTEDGAALLYDCYHKGGVIPPMRVAEFHAVHDGRITSLALVYDPTGLLAFFSSRAGS